MDPNEALKNVRAAIAGIRAAPPGGYSDDLADAFEALDDWLSKGGALPDAWREASPEYLTKGVCPECGHGPCEC